MKNTLQILEDARKLIEKPEAWTKGASSRNENGKSLNALDPEGICFCSYGALVRANGGYNPFQPGYAELFKAVGMSPIEFNDSRTHTEVLAAFDRAIEAERAKVPA